MGAMFRSEEMVLAQLFIQPEAAYSSLSEMGEIGVVQFRDLNVNVNMFERKFINEVRRCDEMERKLRYIEAEVSKDKVSIPDPSEVPRAPNPREIIDLEAHLEKTEGEIQELSGSAVGLKTNFLELTEVKHVLEKTETFFDEHGESSGDSANKALIPEDAHASIRGRLAFVAGVISRERLPGFERMLWRISRGNVFVRQAEIETPLEDPATGDEMYKTVFVAFYQGEQLKSRIKKICAGFHATLYPCPSIQAERQEMLTGIKLRIEDLSMILNQTEDHRQRVLVNVAKELQNWSVMVRKMKAIYHTLNCFNMDVTKKCLIGECWVPLNDIPILQEALVQGSNVSGSSINSFMNVINTKNTPPTFNRTNKFTQGFQNLIDSYGIASYREVNPALYTIITFPFLFAVMFGDIGHGFILLLFGIFMVGWEKKLIAKKIDSEIWNIFFGGRYIILLMGLFSLYTGLIYNDLFSKSINLFGTSWVYNIETFNVTTVRENEFLTLSPQTDYSDVPYPLGLDPIWQLGKNKIIFLNTYKMKLSIIFGVVHMIFGVCMSVCNYSYFKKFENFFLTFIPQLLFLLCLFCWMVIMMFMKWIMYSARNDEKDNPFSTACAPSVLILFINMMLFTDKEPLDGCKTYLFEGQYYVQMALVAIALLCIPVLLFGKPIYKVMHKSKANKLRVKKGDVNHGMETQLESDDEPNYVETPEGDEGDEEEIEMSEFYINQAIHTIEYVLSTISHTASYLRLWALSLAHAQLSEVLWNMVLKMGLGSDSYVGAIMLYFIFAFWASCTLAILVMMEGLSAFLHTLRLHWVEFMSKFYSGLGYPFEPFSFKAILEAENAEED